MKFKFGVKVMPREVILDTQGRAIQQTLSLNKMNVENCRVGKYIEIEIEGEKEQAERKAEEISKFVLHNPLIETYEIKKID